MDIHDEVRWRLRNGKRIVGYERHIAGRVWSSTDGLWWRGQSISHLERDLGMPCRDVNNQWLFERDIVTWSAHSGQWRLLHVGNQWLLTQEDWTIPAPMESRLLRRVAFAFPSHTES